MQLVAWHGGDVRCAWTRITPAHILSYKMQRLGMKQSEPKSQAMEPMYNPIWNRVNCLNPKEEVDVRVMVK